MREPEEGRAAGKGRRVCVLGEGGGGAAEGMCGQQVRVGVGRGLLHTPV